jgi:hypothetical protein
MSKKLIFILGGLTLVVTALAVAKRENDIKKQHSNDDSHISYIALDYDFDEDNVII